MPGAITRCKVRQPTDSRSVTARSPTTTTDCGPSEAQACRLPYLAREQARKASEAAGKAHDAKAKATQQALTRRLRELGVFRQDVTASDYDTSVTLRLEAMERLLTHLGQPGPLCGCGHDHDATQPCRKWIEADLGFCRCGHPVRREQPAQEGGVS